jgi:signal peptidase I
MHQLKYVIASISFVLLIYILAPINWLIVSLILFLVLLSCWIRFIVWSKLFGKKSNLPIIWYLMAAIVLGMWMRIFIFEIYTIPSESMEKTLLPGDRVLVFKLAYGPALPRSPFDIPWFNVFFLVSDKAKQRFQEDWWAFRRLKGLGSPLHNDVIVFRSPHKRHEFLIKRCVGLPGDTLKIINHKACLIKKNKDLVIESMSKNKYYPCENEFPYSDSTENINQVYPYSELFHWSINNFGPLIIPKKGMTITLNDSLGVLYGSLFTKIEDVDLKKASQNAVSPSTIAVKEFYTFQNDYYFFLGDNRHASYDSRYFGFIPEHNIVGKAVFVLFNYRNGGFSEKRWFKRVK